MSLKLITPPAVEPVTLEEAKKQVELPLSATSHDDQLTRLIKAAREDVERHTRRALITQTWRRSLPAFPSGRIFIPRPPLRSVSIEYYDGVGVSQSLASELVQVDTDSAPGSVEPAPDETWPSTQALRRDAVTIEFECGFGDAASDVPEVYRQLILEIVAFRFWYRGDMQMKIPDHIMWSMNALRCGAHGGFYGLRS